MSCTINASTSAGLITSADTTGILQLQTNSGTTAVTIDTSQNMGIGTTSPGQKLSVVAGSGSSAYVEIQSTGFTSTLFGQNNAGDAYIYNGYAGNIRLFTGASERARIDSSGNVGIGSTPVNSRRLTLNTSSQTDLSIVAGSTSYAQLLFGYTGADNKGILAYNNSDNSMQFYTNSSERMRIDTNGNLLVGATSGSSHKFNISNSSSLMEMANSNASPVGLYVTYSTASPNGTSNEFLICRDTTVNRVLIRSNGGIANYSANNVNLSDRREKTNFAPATAYLDKICAIPVQTFNYIDQNMEEDGGLTLGVVAQDVQAVAPELVMESNWANKDQEPKMRLSIYQTDLQYALMKSIQELNTFITAQAAEITALKAKVG